MTEKTAKGNDPVEKTKIIERNYLVCDGCGYVIGWNEERMTAKIQVRDSLGHLRISEELHFHIDPPGNARDCVKYWWSGRTARELREKREDERSSSKAGS